MSAAVPAVAPIVADDLVAPAASPANQAHSAQASMGRFGEWFSHELGEVNGKLVNAEQGMRALAAGEASSLHDVMIKMEEARLSFQLAIQFRTRVLEAYQDVMRMQI